MSGHPRKIFGIGLSRTGTTSLHNGLSLLGLDSAPSSVALMTLLDDPGADVGLLDRHDAFTDNPVPFLYRVLDERFPDARFVLTTRQRDDWLASMHWLFGPGLDRLDPDTRRLGDRVHERLYGITSFDEQVLGDVYDRHHQEVEEHFSGREGDLLQLETSGLAWQPLCSFLEIEEPSAPFPHVNRGSRVRSMNRLRRFVGGDPTAWRRGSRGR